MKINGVSYGECDVCKSMVPLKTIRSVSGMTYCQVCYQNLISGEFRPLREKCHGCKVMFPVNVLNYDGPPLCEECYARAEDRDEWSTDRDQQECPDCPTCIADGIGSARPL